eukprot:141590-Pleurochrysis_carterae.AAC.1
MLISNPHIPYDVFVVPSIFPSLDSFAQPLKGFSAEHQWTMSFQGRVAVQSLESLAGEITRETARVKGKPLSFFSSARTAVRIVVQVDAARRRTRQFVACIAKNP